jgi:hypothetical protein
MIRRITAALTAAILTTVGVVVAAASPAHAEGCTPNYLCLFNGGAYNELLSEISPYEPAGRCIELSSYTDNKTDYIVNSTFFHWTPYTGDNCSGTSGIIYARSGGAMAGIWLDNIESLRKRETR